jgi:hypothetical protein
MDISGRIGEDVPLERIVYFSRLRRTPRKWLPEPVRHLVRDGPPDRPFANRTQILYHVIDHLSSETPDFLPITRVEILFALHGIASHDSPLFV